MRMVEMIWSEGEEKFECEDDDAVAICCWKTPAGIVLEIIDEQLAPFGLEIVQYDDHIWRVEKRAASPEVSE